MKAKGEREVQRFGAGGKGMSTPQPLVGLMQSGRERRDLGTDTSATWRVCMDKGG